MALALTDLIDLDAIDSPLGENVRLLTMDFFVLYIRGRMRPDEFRTLTVWLGLLDEILPVLDQKTHKDLPLTIAKAMYSTDLSFLVGACIMCSEVIRIFTVDEQKELINKLNRI